MSENKNLLGSGWGMVRHNKRYIVWFYVLNVLLGLFGTAPFTNQARPILEHSLQSERLLHGFSLGVLIEMFSRPELGPTMASRAPAMFFALLFVAATALFLPGIFQGYASTYRLPREEFFRACGRNLWRFIRLLIVAGIIMGAVAGALFGLRGVLAKKAAESTNELLLPEARFAGLLVIFLVMTMLRIWFDLAQGDVVLSDQRAVRKSIAAGFRHTWRNLGRLLGSYVITTIVAVIILVAGISLWIKLVPPASVLGAVLVSQLTLLFLLIPRFWQRGIAVSYYLGNMVEAIAVEPITPVPITPAPVREAIPTPEIPILPPEPLGS